MAAKYKVTLDSAVYGHDATKWDTVAEAIAAITSIEAEANKLNDGIRRVVRVIYRGKVLKRIVIEWENCPKCGVLVTRDCAFTDEGEGEETGRTFYYCSEHCRETH